MERSSDVDAVIRSVRIIRAFFREVVRTSRIFLYLRDIEGAGRIPDPAPGACAAASEIMKRKTGWILVVCLLAAACVVWAVRTGESRSMAERSSAKRSLRLITYNVGVFNKYLEDDYRLVADVLSHERPDAVALNELDSCTRRTGGVFQLERIASLMGGWAFRFGAAMPFGGGSYGDGVMTRDGILRTQTAVLPQAGGAEPRALVIVETEDYVFAATHLDHVSAAAQHEQVRAIDSLVARFVAGVRKPVFLAGDMNAAPDSETIRLFRQRWHLLTPTDGGTYPSDPPRECIDYIFAWRDGVPCEVVEARVLNRSAAGDLRRASDHLPVLLEVAW